MKKIRLVFNNQSESRIYSGMDLYRLAMPYTPFAEKCDVRGLSLDEFDMNPLDADVYVMNRPQKFRAKMVKDAGKILVVDIDDYWKLPTWHKLSAKILKDQLDFAAKYPNRVNPTEVNNVRRAYDSAMNLESNTLESARIADLVTVTTETLQSKLKKVGIDSVVVKNTIHPMAKQFSTNKNKSNRVRFGWVGGSFHGRDVALMFEGMRRLHGDKTLQGKYQLLSSFNDNSEYREIERILTINYLCCSEDYRTYLKQYSRLGSHIGNNETYKRLWNLDILEYGAHYEQIDVALIPLQHGEFNACKSELKLIEAGTTGCAAIVSNVLPYNKWLKHGYNCLLADGTNGWYTAMKMLTDNDDLRHTLAENLRKTIQDNFDTIKESNILATELNRIECLTSE